MRYITLVILALLIVIAGCAPSNSYDSEWKDVELQDVRTGEQFSISDYEGQKIFVETFAVWCTSCKEQQDEIQKFHELHGDEAVTISLNADPNEEVSAVKEHIQRNDYDWKYAIAPPQMTQQMLDEFGVVIVNAPQAPIILICEDNSYSLLPSGVKNLESLELALEAC